MTSPTSDVANAYEAVVADNDTAHWAFGTGFSDPLAGIDTSLPGGVDGDDLAAYCVMLGDDALILSHRLQQWCTHAPELEEELALANLALDLLGQARLLLTRAGSADRSGQSADDYAFGREAGEFRNVRLAELDNGDFAVSIARLLVLATWRLAVFRRLAGSLDPVLAAIAAKGVHELSYHHDYAATWTIRLGDGTEHSHERMQAALEAVWPLVDELFATHPIEARLAASGVAVDPADVEADCRDSIAAVLAAAALSVPDVGGRAGVSGRTGRDGVHTEALGLLLAELQSVARSHPGATW